MEYRLIRSRRRTLGVEVRNGEILVRAPLKLPRGEIDRFVEAHGDWIARKMAEQSRRSAAAKTSERLTPAALEALAAEARRIIPERVAYYAPLVGVDYGRITIRSQHTRWGSCSAAGNLNFNCLLLLAPPAVLDSVVVHELCHRKEMNHSSRFYGEVLRVMPDYRMRHRWLKENGGALLARLPEK